MMQSNPRDALLSSMCEEPRMHEARHVKQVSPDEAKTAITYHVGWKTNDIGTFTIR